jgi:hypothetical protein
LAEAPIYLGMEFIQVKNAIRIVKLAPGKTNASSLVACVLLGI